MSPSFYPAQDVSESSLRFRTVLLAIFVKWSIIKHAKVLINKKKVKQTDKGALKQRKEYFKLEMEELSILTSEGRYTIAEEELK